MKIKSKRIGKKLATAFFAFALASTITLPVQAFAENPTSSAEQQSTASLQTNETPENNDAASSSTKNSKTSEQTFNVQFKAVNDSGDALNETAFEIKAKDGNTLTADSHVSLAAGSYTVSESQTPSGYQTPKAVDFTLDADGNVTVNGKVAKDRTISIVNEKDADTTTSAKSGSKASKASSASGSSSSSTSAATAHALKSSKKATLKTQTAGSDASAHMHATITTNNDTYEAGTTAIVTFKYTLDRGSVSTGDYVIVTIPSSIASKVRFSLNSQHFSGSEDLGNGQYKLTFGSGIESGISGSFNAYVTANSVDATTPGTISAGDASKTITIVPSGSPSGTGTYTDTIMKDGFENDGVSYGGYDYSEGYGNNAAQIGIADLTNGGTFKYRLCINDKKGNISNVTVVDRIPDGMTLNLSKSIEVTDQATGKTIDPSNYSIEIDGQTLTFKYPGSTSSTIQVNYWVDIPAESNTSKYTNTATITYAQNAEIHQEHRNYVLQGTDNNASNGEKSVDKSIISTDPDDQFVTYTIKFWNSNGFAAGEINLTDELDSHVSFVSADESDYFSIEQDASDPHKIKITNTKAIESSTTTYVRFMVDMSNVPVGYTVKNSVGGNTTKTTKYGGGLTLDATKQIDGKGSGLAAGQFSFQLLSVDGTVLQTKTNDADGNIAFDGISYNTSDVGKTFTYKVKEVSGDDTSYTYDSSVYTVTVAPQLETDSDGSPTGNIIATPSISKDGTAVDSMTFNNTSNTGSLRLTKTSTGHETPASAEFAISGPGGWNRTVTYAELQGGSIVLDGLPVGTYTVKESGADVDGWTLSVGGDATAEVTKGGTAELSLENAYTQDKENPTPNNNSGNHHTPTGTDTTKSKQGNKAKDTDNPKLTKASTQNTSSSASTEETASASSGMPETGDSTDMAFWPLMFAAAGAAGILVLANRRRNKDGSKDA